MAKNLLQQHFPMIRVRQEVEERIYHNRKLRAVFEEWTAEQRKELDLLQKYYFVPLDIFRENIHNKSTKTKLDAWLIFLTSDSPEMIMELIEEFPEFKRIYEDIYELCRNIEGVMQMFSKELQELDRNTVQYMIDTMQDEIDASKKKLDKQKKQLSEQEQQLSEQEKQLSEQEQQLSEQRQQLSEQEQQLSQQEQQLTEQEKQLIESRIRIEKQQRAERLYALLVSEGRLEALGRAVNDEAYREQLFAEYQL